MHDAFSFPLRLAHFLEKLALPQQFLYTNKQMLTTISVKNMWKVISKKRKMVRSIVEAVQRKECSMTLAVIDLSSN